MSYELTGKLHKKLITEVKGDSFRSRDFIVETDGQYPQLIKIQLVQDRCESIDNIREGATVKVYFDLRGREWNERYYTNLQAWRVEPVAAVHGDPLPSQAEQKANDDLPF